MGCLASIGASGIVRLTGDPEQLRDDKGRACCIPGVRIR